MGAPQSDYGKCCCRKRPAIAPSTGREHHKCQPSIGGEYYKHDVSPAEDQKHYYDDYKSGHYKHY